MKIEKVLSPTGVESVVLVDEEYKIVEEVSLFLRHLEQKGKSLGTVESYCRDLKEFFTWLSKEGINFYEVRPRKMFSFVKYLDTEAGRGNKKSPSTLNRYLASVNAFYGFYESLHGYQEIINDLPAVKPREQSWFKHSVFTHKVSSKHQ